MPATPEQYAAVEAEIARRRRIGVRWGLALLPLTAFMCADLECGLSWASGLPTCTLGEVTPDPIRPTAVGCMTVGVVGALVVGAWLSAATGSPVYLVFFAVVIAVNTLFFIAARKRADQVTELPKTGRVLGPLPPTQVVQRRWAGGASVVGSFGRVRTSIPVAVLELASARVTLRLRPRVLGWLCGVRPLVLTSAEVAEIYPVKASFGASAVGVQPRGRPVAYFLIVAQPEPILTAFARAGFNVSWAERRRR